MDNFKFIYRILKSLEDDMDCKKFDLSKISSNDLGISEERWAKYLEMMVDAGYIKGVTIRQYTTGETQIICTDSRITLKGLEYLTENSIMQKIYRTAKGIKDITPGL